MAPNLVDGGDPLPSGQLLVYLPAIGSNRRLPAFWSDRAVRRVVIATHRQIMIDEVRDRIRSDYGAARTPSKSALQRAWARIDKAIAQARVRPVRAER